jgi:hypothetical protein
VQHYFIFASKNCRENQIFAVQQVFDYINLQFWKGMDFYGRKNWRDK